MGKRGPAPKGEYTNKSAVFSTRLRKDTRDALTQAANQSGRSLSQEVEHRLRRSFDEDRRIDQVFGDRSLFGLMRVIAAVIGARSTRAAKWADDPVAFDQAKHAIDLVLDAFRPPGDPTPPKDAEFPGLEELRPGMTAGQILFEIKNADDQLPLHGRDRAAIVKSDLGPKLVKRIDRQIGDGKLVSGTSQDIRRAADRQERHAVRRQKGARS